MKVLMLIDYYPEYLSYFYRKHPGVLGLAFEDHREALLDDHFGWQGELCRHMRGRGIDSWLVVGNDRLLQQKWAKQQGFAGYRDAGWQMAIVREQIKRFRPDVLWVGSSFHYYGKFLKSVLPYCGKAICWISCPVPPKLDLSGFAGLVTRHPVMLREKWHLFRQVVVTKPGFDSAVLDAIGNVRKRHPVSFIGNFTPGHAKRAEIIAYLLRSGVEISLFGSVYGRRSFRGALREAAWYVARYMDLSSGISALKRYMKPTSYQEDAKVLSATVRPPVFGLDMYRELAASILTLNIHIDIADNFAGNMRLFEATGVGACVLTEHSANIGELFVPGQEVVTYRGKEDLLRVVRELLANPEEASRIARAGQERTLSSHTISRMFDDLRPVFEM